MFFGVYNCRKQNISESNSIPTTFDFSMVKNKNKNIRFLRSLVAEKNATKNTLGRMEGQKDGQR